MLSGDSVIAGTNTAGTGTLALAATPTPPGGLDFDVWAAAIGVALSGAVALSYTIIEYTDATFATAKQEERGVGLLTRGASAGIANCTLTRSTIISTTSSMNAQPASVSYAPSTGISIGTAANVLVFLGPSAADQGGSDYLACDTIADAAQQIGTDLSYGGYSGSNISLTTSYLNLAPIIWRGGRPLAKASVYVPTATASAKLELAVYALVDHNTAVRVVDLCNNRTALFDCSTTGVKTNAAPTFPATFLPPGQYIQGYLSTGASSVITGSNMTSPCATILGTISGQPIGRAIYVAPAGLPASITLNSGLVQAYAWGNPGKPYVFLGW